MKGPMIIKAMSEKERDLRIEDSEKRGYVLDCKGKEYSPSVGRMTYWAKVKPVG